MKSKKNKNKFVRRLDFQPVVIQEFYDNQGNYIGSDHLVFPTMKEAKTCYYQLFDESNKSIKTFIAYEVYEWDDYHKMFMPTNHFETLDFKNLKIKSD